MAKMAYVCLYHSYLNTLEPLPEDAQARLLMAMLRYSALGRVPRLTGEAKVLWPMIRSQIDRDMQKYREKCETNRINGAKGGRASKTANADERLPSGAKEKEKEKENEKENEKEKEKEREKEKEKENALSAEVPSAPLPSFPPSEEEVREYCRQQGLALDVSRFVDHYTSNGWMVGTNKMRDWQAAVRNWNRKELNFGKTELGKAEPIYGNIL